MDYRPSTKMPFIMFPIDITATREFAEWIQTPQTGVWFLLHSTAVRNRFKTKVFGTHIYDKYYKNGMVISYLTQTEMRERLNYRSKGYISNTLNTLCEQGIIKGHRDKFKGKSIKLYQTAEVLDVEEQLESMLLIKFLRRQIAKNQLAKYK